MSDVFISYKTEDRACAAQLADALQARGLTVWWDRNLVGGDSFRDTIKTELDAADVVIVIWSPRSVESGWVLDEADRAASQKKLLPVSFEGGTHIPMGFGNIHVQDLSDWHGAVSGPEIDAIVSGITRVKEGDFSALGALGRGVGARRREARRLLANLGNSVGGLPFGRFFMGGLLYAIPPSLLTWIGLFLYREAPSFTEYFGSVAALWIVVLLLRGLHQYVVVSKGRSARRFLDPGFTFWTLFSLLCAIILSAVFVIFSEDVLGPFLVGAPGFMFIVLAIVTIARVGLTLMIFLLNRLE
tara:strand:- start:1137 stop:2036 length:900 start_codon:yes stop_codon:yes gene_type:complete